MRRFRLDPVGRFSSYYRYCLYVGCRVVIHPGGDHWKLVGRSGTHYLFRRMG